MRRNLCLLLKSFFSPAPHVAALRGEWKLGQIFLTQFLGLCVLLFLLFTAAVAYLFYEVQPAIRALPPFEIADGRIITKFRAPVTLNLRDYNMGILVDPSLSISDIVEKKRTTHEAYVVNNAFIVAQDDKKKYNVKPFGDIPYQQITPTTVYVLAPMLLFSGMLSMPIMAVIVMPLIVFGLAPMVTLCALLTAFLLASIFARPLRAGPVLASTLALLPPGILYLTLLLLWTPVPKLILYPVFFGLFMAMIFAVLQTARAQKAQVENDAA